jgi:hypothetical protein
MVLMVLILVASTSYQRVPLIFFESVHTEPDSGAPCLALNPMDRFIVRTGPRTVESPARRRRAGPAAAHKVSAAGAKLRINGIGRTSRA